MEQLQIFVYDTNAVRTVIRDGEPWFVARDVTGILDVDVTQIRRLDDDEKGLRSIQTPGGLQDMVCVNEPGLYTLVLGSRKSEAKAFKRWITHEVIPSIRKHGAYMTPRKLDELLNDPDTLIKLLTDLKEERRKHKQLSEKVEADKSKVLFAEALEISGHSVLVGELAKLLKQNSVDIGQNRLFQMLRDDGYLIRAKGEQWNDPTQRSMDLKLFEVKRRTINNLDGSVQMVKTTKVTPKGQIYFVNKFKNPTLEEAQ